MFGFLAAFAAKHPFLTYVLLRSRAAVLFQIADIFLPAESHVPMFGILTQLLGDFEYYGSGLWSLSICFMWFFNVPPSVAYFICIIFLDPHHPFGDLKPGEPGYSFPAIKSILPLAVVYLGPSVLSNPSLLYWIGYTLLVLLPLFPGLYWGRDTGTINTFTPEDHQGIWAGIVFYLYRISLPRSLQWLLLYSPISMPHPRMYLMFIEWFVCSFAWWFLEVPIDVGYTIQLTANIFVHAIIIQNQQNSRQTSIVTKEKSGTLWFVGTSLALRLAHWALGSWFLWFSRICLALITLPVIVCTLFGLSGPLLSFVFAGLYDNKGANNSKFSNPTEFKHKEILYEGEFRILRLRRRPLFTDGCIESDIIHVSLFNPPQYIAISYRWSDAKDDHKIIINGSTYMVPSNVYEILHAKRSRWRDRLLWIDSICINQKDDKDKNQQVKYMQQIFSEAFHVIGWLGNNPGLENARDLLYRIYSWRFLHNTSTPNKSLYYLSKEDAPLWADLQKLITSDWFERIWIVQEIVLADQPWLRIGSGEVPWKIFARVMTILSQQGLRDTIVFPQATPDSFWDGGGIENALIMDNVRRCCRSAHTPKHISTRARQWMLDGERLSGKKNEMLSLMDTLKLCLRFKSSYPVDKVYGLLGIIAERNNPPVDPDYRKSVWSVYVTVACYLVLKEDIFSFLHLAGVGQTINIATLPSWVPDWSAELQASTLAHTQCGNDYRASGGSTRHAGLGEDFTTILVKGIQVDKIAHLINLSPDPIHKTSQNTRKVARSIFSSQKRKFQGALDTVRRHAQSPYPVRGKHEATDEAFWRTVVADVDPTSRPASPGHVKFWRTWIDGTGPDPASSVAAALSSSPPDEAALRKYILESHLYASPNVRFAHLLSTELSKSNTLISKGFGSIRDHVPEYYRYSVQFTVGRQFCVTERGYMGLVPALAGVGDQVAILFGGTTPFVLRRSLPETGRDGTWYWNWRLVGESYFHGMMDGEMVSKETEVKERVFRLR